MITSLLRTSGRAGIRPFSKLTIGSNVSPSVPFDIHPEVLDALKTNKPVVALETTLVTHGFQYPTNFALAQSLENIVRSTGAVPATIGIVEGRVKVGLQKAELERLANPPRHGSVAKISRRDIAPAIAMKADGGTTCSATLIFSALAGIKVFATGGLGGVHRGGESSMDISADLHELERCPVGLVSSGVKSILDIGRTLEYLETLGVPVVPLGASKQFPAFFSPRSGFELPWNAESPSVAANILHTQSQLRMQHGVLFAVPIPDKYEAIGAEIQLAVDQAVAESEANGISRRGKEATPWLLKRISEITKGLSETSNIALLENNALLGGQIAVEYQRLAQEHPYSDNVVTFSPRASHTFQASIPSSTTKILSSPFESTKLIVLGAAAVDISARSFNSPSNSALCSTVPGKISVALGGVGRNVAEASHRITKKNSVLLISPIGDDLFGDLLMRETQHSGMRTDGLLLQKAQQTAVCNMMMDDQGNLTTGIADMAITEALSATEVIRVIQRNKPVIIAMDGNSSPEVISMTAQWCMEQGIKVFFEPTSVVKSTRILKAVEAIHDASSAPIDFISPNILELQEIFSSVTEAPMDLTSKPNYWAVLDSLSLTSQFRTDLEHLSRRNVSEDPSTGNLSFLLNQGLVQMATKLLPFFRHIIVKCGDKGVLVSNVKARYIISHGNLGETVVVYHFPALPLDNVVSVTGAGDTLVGAIISCLAQRPYAFENPESMRRVIDVAQRAALLTLNSHSAVSPRLSELREVVSKIPAV